MIPGPGPSPAPSSETVARRFRREQRRDTAHELAVRRRLRKDPVLPTPRRLGAVPWTGPTAGPCTVAMSRTPTGNWWVAKLAGNVARDRRADAVLRTEGWRVLRFWEHEDPDAVADAICAALGRRPSTGG